MTDNQPNHAGQSRQTPESPETGGEVHRRGLLKWAMGLAVAVAVAAAAVPILGFLFRPWIRWREDEWVEAGRLDDFREHETRLVKVVNPVVEPWGGRARKLAMYVRRQQAEEFTVFAVNCTHLECPVAWFPESGLFLCPCHGGVYKADGQNVAGPPPRPLYRYPHRVEGGKLLVKVGHLPNLSETG